MYSDRIKHYAIFLYDVKNQDESIQVWKQILNDQKIVEESKKYVEKTLANIPKDCCYTHDDQREPLEGIKKILDGNKKWSEWNASVVVAKTFPITIEEQTTVIEGGTT